MDKERPKPPMAGIVYGQIAYLFVIIGLLVALIGTVIYFTSDGYVNKECVLDKIWDGEKAEVIWQECAGESEIPTGHWYFGKLSDGDGIATLGIAIASVAAAFGMWGAFIAMWRARDRLYMIFALVAAIVISLSALGIIQME